MKTPEELMKLQSEALSASSAVMGKTLESFQKLAELNLKAATESFSQSTEQLKTLMAAKDPAGRQAAVRDGQAFAALSAYAKDFYELSSKAGAELAAMAESRSPMATSSCSARSNCWPRMRRPDPKARSRCCAPR